MDTYRPGTRQLLANVRTARSHVSRGMLMVSVLGMAACGGMTDAGDLPPDVQDPATIQTPTGTMGYYRGTIELLGRVADRVIISGGELTDELMASPSPLGVTFTPRDSRQAPGDENVYTAVHNLRAQTRDVRGFLSSFTPDSSPALIGHMYALEGYADVFLADLFCSGIPLSTVDYNGDFTIVPGSSTDGVYAAAVELFDSASAVSSDSAAFQYLAAVGRGRALLARGLHADAAAAVAEVPSDYVYRAVQESEQDRFLWKRGSIGQGAGQLTVGDGEGITGLDYQSSGDPRTAVQFIVTDAFEHDIYFPAKYPVNGAVTYAMASGIEARLIEAEAALRASPNGTEWLQKLNALRQTAWTTIVPATGGPLPDLVDPGPDFNDRVDMVFEERAFWLYLSGHRQPDMRRLIRQYQRLPSNVYPSGFYPGGTGEYGDEVVMRVPDKEMQYNPQYTGCIHRNA